ncbi:MAG: methyltransferase domain-containing protein [Planctomycetes bacterium]|nr:methyltransferase domain-containing protein [Planctomycetota bacterium]
MAESKTAYDEIPYRSMPFPDTRPERLAAVAKLFGLDAPAVDRCRVLELGCAAGGNLVGTAQDYPHSRFVGVDASSRQIADGWTVVDALRLKNIQLQHLDILDIGADFGEFDYIISHGLFSWAPAKVQDRMIELCRRHLAPNGVAYISYNTFPGWHIRGIVRDMMLFRGMQFADPAARLAQSKALVEFVAKSVRSEDSPYKRLLQAELEFIGKQSDYYLHHDHLEENNRPMYFHEFARKLAVNGLQYLGEAEFATMVSTNFPPDVAETLHKLGAHDILQMEQYMDFVRCRYFRKSLICHRALRLNRVIQANVAKVFWFASRATPARPEPSLAPADVEVFRTPSGLGINCRHPLTKLALLTLGRQWPRPMKFSDLLAKSKAEAAAKKLPFDEGAAEPFLADEMLGCMAAGIVEWSLGPALFTTDIAERPTTTPLARLQAARTADITNLRGERVTLDDFHRVLLRHLDGTRDRAQLAEAMVAFLKGGGHVLRREADNTPVTDEAEIRRLLDEATGKALQNFAGLALLPRPA